jgi:putative sterol carrier protein
MENRTSTEFFEKVLPARFKPEKAEGIDIIAQISILGVNEGDWIVTIKNKKLTVEKGLHESPTLTLKVSEKDFMDIVNGKLKAEKAFFTGKIQFKGNIGVALKLREVGFL